MTTPTTTSRRPLRVGHLVSGLVSLGLAGVWALWAAGAVDGLSVSLLLPGVLVVAGALGLTALLLGGRRAGSAVPAPADESPDQTLPYPTKEP